MSGDSEDMRDEISTPGDNLPPECAAVSGELAELALGTLTGRERVTALSHLEGCARCSAEVDSLSAAADQLLYLAPATEPPVGFEAGVFGRLGLQGKPPRRWSWFVWSPKVAASIAACVLVLVFGIGALVGNLTHGGGSYRGPQQIGGPHSSLALASLVSDGHDVGRVMVYAGNPTWLMMFMDDPTWQGVLRCEVVIQDGPTVTLGRFWLADGKGAWAASVDQPAGRLSEARIVNAHGQVLAEADLS
ncbi:MAG TPA: hypothetical protein VEJ84_23105 [Acidimicrobiales bacterium]|nr:hypothetical protein [Acidimicrobiales bacterium]